MTDDPRLEAVKQAFTNYARPFDRPLAERAARQFCAMIRAFLGEDAERKATAAPIPMILHCPYCCRRHIDKGEFATKPHHTHACQACGVVWRPAVVPTVGVQFLPGFKDDPDEDAERKEVIDHRSETTQDGSLRAPDNVSAPAVTGADPEWLDEAAKAAALASPADPDEWDQYSESIRDVWRRAARAVLQVANAQPVSDDEVRTMRNKLFGHFVNRSPEITSLLRAALEAAAKVRTGG